MLIYGLNNLVQECNKNHRSELSIDKLLKALPREQAVFLSTGSCSTLPYVNVDIALSYVDRERLSSRQVNRYTMYTGPAKQYISNARYWNQHYLLHKAKLSDLVNPNTLAMFMNTVECSWLSDLVIMQPLNFKHVCMLMQVDFTKLTKLKLRIPHFDKAMFISRLLSMT